MFHDSWSIGELENIIGSNSTIDCVNDNTHKMHVTIESNWIVQLKTNLSLSLASLPLQI